MISWRTLYLRKSRRERAECFSWAHAINCLVWSAPSDVWPEMALTGPWRGLAEDLTNQSLTVAKASGDEKKTFGN